MRRGALVVLGIGLSFVVLLAAWRKRAVEVEVMVAHPVQSAVSRMHEIPLLTAPNVPAAPAGTSRRARLHELAECSDAELRHCLAPFIKPQLTATDIVGLQEAHCFEHGRDGLLEQAGDCLPLRVGVDSHLRRTLMLAFYCSDICPEQGDVQLAYENVAADECCKLGAEPFRDPAWGGYQGCEPAETAIRHGFLHHVPGGKWQRVVGSYCAGREQTIYEEWDCEPPPAVTQRFGLGGGRLRPDARSAPNMLRHPNPECPTSFNPVEAENALRAFDGDVRHCWTGRTRERAKLRVTFAATGNVVAAQLTEPPGLDHADALCVEKHFRRVHTLAFKGEPVEVWHELWAGSD